MKLTKEQMLMVNGALAEYRLAQTESKIWAEVDEKNFQQIVLKLRKDYANASKGVKSERV